MTDDDVERLRRVAYGPGAGAAERAEAEAALQALAERRSDPGDAAVADVEVLASLDDSEVDGAVQHSDDADEVATPIWERRIRVGWVVPIVVGSLVAGALGALQATGQFAPKARFDGPYTISPTAPAREGSIEVPGDLEAADSWFDGPATASDAYPFGSLLETEGIDPYDVRFAATGGDGWNVWVGRSTDRKLCLLIADLASTSGATGCFERARFAINGAHLGLGERMAHWFGAAVMTGPGSESLTDPDTAPALPSPAQGDVAAALDWFTQPPTEADEFPHLDVLADLGIVIQNVRRVFGEAPPAPAVWVAKREVDGLCLLMTEWPASTASSCVTVEEFREAGVSLESGGFSASWDGEQVVAG